jgi:two-component system cell cycle sensor histidine kinase/response regulator CckA
VKAPSELVSPPHYQSRGTMPDNVDILIVEESLTQSEQLKHILETHDHHVTIEHNGKLALAAMRQRQPAIVISAINLREMDGYQLCSEIKADESLKHIPVILLTTLSGSADIIRGLECGADNFITKPYDEKLLVSRVEYILLNRELRESTRIQTGLEIIFGGEKYLITSERQQIVDLLISTYETAMQKNLELIRVEKKLTALNERLEQEVNTRTGQLAGEVEDRLAAEDALRVSEARLQQAQKMEAIGRLAGGVAHDFNNLLTVILGNTQLDLAERKLEPDDPSRLRLVEVEQAGNRAAVLTRQLLAFSRRQRLERRTINLNDTIGQITDLIKRVIGADVEVFINAAPDLSAVYADPAQIEQVLMNLGVNARDAMPQGGRLTIETSNVELDETYRRRYPYVKPGRYVEIRVSDTGTGMNEETQTHIFEPFFTTKEIGKGTGLGLPMVYGIIKQHDGHINVYSEIGCGTAFKIFLPVDQNVVHKAEQAAKLPLVGGSEMILVAEDEEALRNLARDILEGLGYAVLLAPNGEEALRIYRDGREQIDLLLLDVVMPRMGGLEAYKQVREANGTVPLILMTGYSADTIQERFLEQDQLLEQWGAVVIQKPYSVEGLGRKVREVLDKARLREPIKITRNPIVDSREPDAPVRHHR